MLLTSLRAVFVSALALASAVNAAPSLSNSSSSDSSTTTLQSTIQLTGTKTHQSSSSSTSSDSPTTALTTTGQSTTYLADTRTRSAANSTVTPGPPVCCFVVQDTVTEDYWLQYSTLTYYRIVNLTSITTLVTPYPSVTSTNYETNVYTTNATFRQSQPVDVNPISLYTNPAPGPVETTNVLNTTQIGTQVVTGGVTVASPQAFYVYPTVKIITVPAVTDEKGNVACGTFSGFPSVSPATSYSASSYPFYTYSETEIITATQYSTLPSSFLTPYTTYTTTSYNTETEIQQTFIPEAAYTTTVKGEPTFAYANQFVGAYFGNNDTKPTGVVISLTTPFIYLPSRGVEGATQGVPDKCAQRPGGSVDFGYVPQTLVDFLVANPAYNSQYPGLASCLPGGPSVLQFQTCAEASPESENAGGDLTSSTLITVTPSEIKATSGEPQPTTAAPLPKSTVPVELPESTTPAPQSSATMPVAPSSEPAPTPSSPPSEPQPSFPPTPVSPSTQESQAPGPVQSQAPTKPVVAPQPGTSPASNSPTWAQASAPASSNGVPPAPENSPNAPQGSAFSNGIVLITASSSSVSYAPASQATSAALGSVVASVIGAQPITGSITVIRGTSAIIVSGETTIPVNPSDPLSGLTAVISGTTNVIVSVATTIPVSQVVQSLPGYTTLVSGTLNVVLPSGTTIPVNSQLPGLTGNTEIVSGGTFVVISGPQTVPVVLGQPTPSGGQATQPFPGSTTLISGTSEVVIPGNTLIPMNSALPGLTGSKTVVSGSTYVIVSSPTTVPVVVGSSTAGPAQVTVNTASSIPARWLCLIFGVGLAALLV